MKRIRIGLVGIATTLLVSGGLALPLSASAQAPTVTEYNDSTNLGIRGGIAKGPDGNEWFTENNANKIAKITPSGTITEYSSGLTQQAQALTVLSLARMATSGSPNKLLTKLARSHRAVRSLNTVQD